MTLVHPELSKYLYHFNHTAFNLAFQRKDFIEIVINSGKSLMGPIYEINSTDINFASALINSGITFDPNELLFGLYTRHYTALERHIEDIKINISARDYIASYKILDAMYSNGYIKHYHSSDCFDPPAIIANLTKTNKPEYSNKIFQTYRNLYDNGSIVIKDVLDIAAIIALKSFNESSNVSFISPILDDKSFKHALHYATENQDKVACLLPFRKFDTLEIGRSLHELTHLSINYLFKNNANPYAPSNNTQQEEYHYTEKQMISNLASLMQVNFLKTAIENSNITIQKFKNTLIHNKDILYHLAIDRLDEPRILNHIFRVLFDHHTISTESLTKFIKALYEAEIATKNISNPEVKTALERLGDWAIYPDSELDKESIARFVELHYRFNESSYSQDSLQSMMTYWQDNVSPMVVELKESLNLEECCILDNEFDYNGYIALGAGIVASTSLIILTCSGSLPFPYHLLIETPE